VDDQSERKKLDSAGRERGDGQRKASVLASLRSNGEAQTREAMADREAHRADG